MDPATHIAYLRADAERMASAFEVGPADAHVDACPGWDVRALVEHMAFIHRWADFAVRNARAPGAGEIPASSDGHDLAAYLREGAARLADDLDEVDPDAPTWHVFPVERTMRVWARRQAQETGMHRWDAEHATTGSSSFDPAFAGDGIDEYFHLGLPRVLQREGVSPPRVALDIACTDLADGWTVAADDEGYRVVRHSSGNSADNAAGDAHRPGVGAFVGTAENLLLVLMGRADRSAVTITGDMSAADAWLSLPGW
jgi:uncharacterized protein (TIGR03083 family)